MAGKTNCMELAWDGVGMLLVSYFPSPSPSDRECLPLLAITNEGEQYACVSKPEQSKRRAQDMRDIRRKPRQSPNVHELVDFCLIEPLQPLRPPIVAVLTPLT